MSAPSIGSRLLVQYVGAALWHERIVICKIGQGTFLILTADGDVPKAFKAEVFTVKPNVYGFRRALQSRLSDVKDGPTKTIHSFFS